MLLLRKAMAAADKAGRLENGIELLAIPFAWGHLAGLHRRFSYWLNHCKGT